jgi:hypothetical protein
MKRHRWKWFVAVCVGIAVVRSGTAQAQQPSFTGPPATPRSFTQDIYAGVGRGISTVDNFTGVVAIALIQGTGKDDKGNILEFECDVRVMQGIFVGRDTLTYRGTFSHT